VITDIEPTVDSSPASHGASGRTRVPLLPAAAGAAALAVCCGLPILASLGVAGAIVGLSTGSWIAVALTSIAAVIGVLRSRRRRTCPSAVVDSRSSVAAPGAGSRALGQHEDVR